MPALGSSGIDIRCPDAQPALEDPLASATPALVAHTESALQQFLDDDTITMPALAESATESVDGADEMESDEDPKASSARTPTVTTRLPGAPDSSLPSFRRQMHRTDI